ncbi:hypothetical protein [Olleya sp. YS]|uniref:hypothetical protein n=1 Tax=Olleya sp. YS TaxID=3028318 RepID=UPI002434455B|nr:hypothetical protein [Olleya sp. YS]WGD34162.1 hypothetical protein Ollyesu_10280 [Olleya sp. YS]
MKSTHKLFTAISLFALILLNSCRTEDMEIINPPEEDTLVANSAVANLMQRAASNDGSNDNIIDNANCFNIQLPVTVFVNGLEIIVNSESDFDTIEDIFDELDDDDDSISIQFPITIILADYTEVVISSSSEFDTFSDDCNGENEYDDDIECIDFQYPITASIFNSNNELIETITINDDSQLYNFIDNIDENDIINIQFPITVILSDDTTLVVNNLNELETTINNFEDDCDEDDDYDYNDDDCNSCTDTQLTSILTDCQNWIVDDLERNDNDLEDNYVGYQFNFTSDGTISVISGNDNFSGTWSATGTGNAITVTIDIPGLSDFNDTWNLHEIEQEPGETKIELRLGDDELEFESDCSSGGNTVDDTALVASLTTGDWYVTYYFDDTDETSNYSDYVFNFASDGTATATNTSGSSNGSWFTSSGDETELELNLNFGTTIPLDELADDWDVLQVTNDIISLKDISGDGSSEYLTFERTPTSTGGTNLTNILTDGLWFVASYIEDTDDQTIDYNGYQLDFNANGTVIATNGSNPNNGTWAVQSSGNVLVLDFGTNLPFTELNDEDWDVLSVSETEVIVQDVSGGNGGTDTLTLQKQ